MYQAVLMPTKRLLLGSGDWAWQPEWVCIDASPTSPADYHVSIPPLPDAIKAQQWDTIMGVHVIEHVVKWDVPQLLCECYECLASEGVLILEQPNILYAVKVLLGQIKPPSDGEPGQYDYWPIYGDPTHKDELMLHRWGYHPESLVTLLIEAGFDPYKIMQKPAEYHRPVRDFRLEARK